MGATLWFDAKESDINSSLSSTKRINSQAQEIRSSIVEASFGGEDSSSEEEEQKAPEVTPPPAEVPKETKEILSAKKGKVNIAPDMPKEKAADSQIIKSLRRSRVSSTQPRRKSKIASEFAA